MVELSEAVVSAFLAVFPFSSAILFLNISMKLPSLANLLILLPVALLEELSSGSADAIIGM